MLKLWAAATQRSFAIAFALGAGGCSVYHRFCCEPERPVPEPAVGEVQVTFLGVAGFLIRYRTSEGYETVMTAPLYSNPTIGEIATQPVAPDDRLIEALLPPQDELLDVKAILSGHSHYDHLMDVPYVALNRATRASIYGNDAMKSLLAPIAKKLGRRQLISLEDGAKALEKLRCAGDCPLGYTAIDDRIRVWPILSEHSPQFKVPFLSEKEFPPVQLWRGQLAEPRKDLPTRPGEWVEGTTLAYLIDFLDAPRGKIAFRVYYQDSATREPFGFPPECLIKGRNVDLALLCVGGSETLNRKEQNLVALIRRLEPRFVMGAHWEDFFNPRKLPLPDEKCSPKDSRCEDTYGIPGGKPKDFFTSVRKTLPFDGRFSLPCPDAVTYFQPDAADGWRIRLSSEVWRRGQRPPH
jgi:hypothetical protein